MIQQGDFVKLNYTGKLENGTVFDTTVASVAKQFGLEGKKELHPVTICVGQHMIIPGLDNALIGKAKGSFSITVPPENAFGKKDAKLIRIIPEAQLRQQEINPRAGLHLNVDGNYGVIRSVSSGRCVVDFNHPLASQEVTYDVEVLDIIDDTKDQVATLLSAAKIITESIAVHEDKVTIKFSDMMPRQILDALQEHITTNTKIKTVTFETGTPPDHEHHHARHEHDNHNTKEEHLRQNV